MSTEQDQARLIAERVARRVRGTGGGGPAPGSTPRPQNGAPVSEELSAIREGLHDLENKLERIEFKIIQGVSQPSEHTRARVIDFVSAGPPLAAAPSIVSPPAAVSEQSTIRAATRAPISAPDKTAQFFPATHSPWLRDFNNAAEHASQERFGIEEATVTELVEFFENEKKCSVEPGGKPCDHCAMCSSRGF